MNLEKVYKSRFNMNMLFMGYSKEEVDEVRKHLTYEPREEKRPEIVISFREDMITKMENFIKDCPDMWVKESVSFQVYRAFLYYLIITKLTAKKIPLGPNYPDLFQDFYGIISTKYYEKFDSIDTWGNYFGLKNQLFSEGVKPIINIFVYDMKNPGLQMAINDFLSDRSYEVSLFSTEDALCTYNCTTGHPLAMTHDYSEYTSDECRKRRSKVVEDFVEGKREAKPVKDAASKSKVQQNHIFQQDEEIPKKRIIIPSFSESGIETDYYGLEDIMSKEMIDRLPVSLDALVGYSEFGNLKELFESIIVKANHSRFLNPNDKILVLGFDLFKKRVLSLQKKKKPIKGCILTHNFDGKRSIIEANYDLFVEYLVELMSKKKIIDSYL